MLKVPLIIGLFFLYVWLGPVIRWCFQALKRWHISRWRLAEAVITKTDVVSSTRTDPKRGNSAWTAVLCYSYEVNGSRYHGRVEMEPWYLDIRSALAAADDLIGKNIYVRYRPDSPAKSTWLEQDGGSGQLAAPAKRSAVSDLIMLSLK